MRLLYPLLLLVFSPISLWGQPLPCTEDPPEMTSFCEDACIICDIDGFTGRHSSSIAGIAPPDFCTVVVHNAQWIAFIAGSEDLTVEVATSNCQMGFGLEVGIYEGIDCQNFRMVSFCWGGTNSPIAPGSPRQISNTEPLVVGQYYYLVMDGAFGDNCDWTLTVVEGSTQVAPLMEVPIIEGPLTTCPELVSTYRTPGLSGGTEYDWSLDGQTVSTADSVEVDWSGSGIYELCLTISNACDESPVTCQNIIVESIPVTFYDEILCSGECFALNDTLTLCDEGLFTFEFETEEGCDSTVIVDITVFESTETQLSATICDGDSLIIGGQPYFSTEVYTTVLENTLGCDSTIVLDLTTVICEIEGIANEVPVVCAGEASGQIVFSVANGTPPFTYTWQLFGGVANGGGTLTALGTNTIINGLSIGTYLITINDNFGNDLILIQDVTEPPVLTAILTASDYNGVNVSCADDADGSLLATPDGGVSPYAYAWDNGATSSSIAQLTSGTYTVQVTDAVGCAQTWSSTLIAPELLLTEIQFDDPDCSGGDSGSIIVTSVNGGTPPYLYDLNGSGFSDEAAYTGLSTGTYTMTIEDANGCLADATADLDGRIIPVVNVGVDTALDLGDQLLLNPVSSVPLDSVFWSPAEGLSCVNCPQVFASPLTATTYTIAVTSEDGCTTLDSLTIQVRDVRDVFVPNAFSPNNDGINDRLLIYGGPEVSRILNFRVFNRWGDLLYERKEMLPNASDGAWDGRFNGEVLGSDVFVWAADIEFIDGRVIPYAGDVLLLP